MRKPTTLLDVSIPRVDRAPDPDGTTRDLVDSGDAPCAQRAAFVSVGGGLVATSQTSLYDETGAARDDFGLAPCATPKVWLK